MFDFNFQMLRSILANSDTQMGLPARRALSFTMASSSSTASTSPERQMTMQAPLPTRHLSETVSKGDFRVRFLFFAPPNVVLKKKNGTRALRMWAAIMTVIP